jgi:hypothetical protein
MPGKAKVPKESKPVDEAKLAEDDRQFQLAMDDLNATADLHEPQTIVKSATVVELTHKKFPGRKTESVQILVPTDKIAIFKSVCRGKVIEEYWFDGAVWIIKMSDGSAPE